MQELKEIYMKKGKLLETDPSPENIKEFEGIKDFMDDLKRAQLTTFKLHLLLIFTLLFILFLPLKFRSDLPPIEFRA